jgi:hypothetical protein
MTAPAAAFLLSFAAFLRDVRLAGPDFQQPTMWPWHALAKVLSGEELTRSEVALVKRCTGRSRLPRGAIIRTLVLLCGRRAGKSKFLSAFAVWVALFAHDWRAVLSLGERGVVLLLAVDKKQAAVLSRYAAGICTGELIAPEVVRQTAEEIEFANGAVIEIGTNDHRTVRSRTCLAVIGDEACLWASDGESQSSDEEVVAAAEPSMATVPGGGWLLLSSSPYRPKGLMHKLWRELWGQPNARGALCWVAPSRVMNPSLPEAFVRRKLAEDPLRARSEYLAEWRSTDADFVPADVIEACTDWTVRERALEEGRWAVGFVDMAGGTGLDSAALGLAHREGDTFVLDVLRERRPRFVPAQVIAEYAELLIRYGVHRVTGDRWASGFVADEFGRHGITFEPSALSKSEIYLATLPLLLSGRARLVDNERLRQQLAGLERRVHQGGRESVDHGRASGHDDLSNAAMGAVHLAASGADLSVWERLAS